MGLTAGALQTQIMGLHAMAAALTGLPILQLSEPEGKEMAEAVYAVCVQYNIALSGPRAVWLRLIAVGGMIYVPRVLMVRQAAIAARTQRATAPATADAANVESGGVMDFSALQRTNGNGNMQ